MINIKTRGVKDCVHVGFGYVRFPDKVLSTRHGDVVFLEDVLRESIEKTKEVIEKYLESIYSR